MLPRRVLLWRGQAPPFPRRCRQIRADGKRKENPAKKRGRCFQKVGAGSCSGDGAHESLPGLGPRPKEAARRRGPGLFVTRRFAGELNEIFR